MPMTTTTTRVCTLATACDPRMLSRAMTATTSTANTLIHASLPSAKAELA
jgi:hypothetical protein